MPNAQIVGAGHYVPETIYSNEKMSTYMDTTDEWITERTGIKERRFAKKHEETTTTLAANATREACKDAGISVEDIDFIIFATISPDYYFPGCGVLLQRELGITKTEIGALDIRNQCSGFVYGLSVADQFIKSGMYKTILLVGAEMHSMGMDFTTRGRNVSVIFGDGAGAVIIKATEEENVGVLTTKLHSDGTNAEHLAMINPGSHGGYHLGKEQFGYEENDTPGDVFVTKKMFDDGIYPNMTGKLVFKTAVVKFPQVIQEALKSVSMTTEDIDLLIPHQANLRISQFVQKVLKLPDSKVFNNIQKYGNTTAASIPIALSEAKKAGKLIKGSLLCLAAFGSGFTWGSALVRM